VTLEPSAKRDERDRERMSASGTSRPFAALQQFGRYWGHSGHWPRLTLNGSVANDPERTSHCRSGVCLEWSQDSFSWKNELANPIARRDLRALNMRPGTGKSLKRCVLQCRCAVASCVGSHVSSCHSRGSFNLLVRADAWLQPYGIRTAGRSALPDTAGGGENKGFK
jgi:hypothetical protein